MYKIRKYTINFEKEYQWVGCGRWCEVTDAYVFKILLNLQEKYDLEIISLKLKDTFYKSKITIRCKKEDKNKILMDFCSELGGKITKISM